MTFDKAMGTVGILFGVYVAIASFGILPFPTRPFPLFSVGWAFASWGYCLIRIENLKRQLEQ